MIMIRKSTMEDIPKIMQFMNDNWLKDYALAVDRVFFDWQFVKGDDVNVWIAIDDEKHEVYAMEGVIRYNNLVNTDFATTMWIAVRCEMPMVGLRLGEQLIREMNARASYAIGLSESAVHIQKRLHKPILNMDHYYRLNDLEEYKIAKIAVKNIPNVNDTGYRLKGIITEDEVRRVVQSDMLTMYSPHKSYEYIIWRYLEHPIFNYDLWEVLSREGNTVGMLVTREEEANGNKSAKVIDYYGKSEEIKNLGYSLDMLIRENNYEFIDVYSFGVDVCEYELAGMVRCDEKSKNVIPNHFQPYVCKNTSIYMIRPMVDDARLFRGDADQDKPRYVR